MSKLAKMMTATAMAAALALPIAGVLPVATAMIVSAPAQAEAQENTEDRGNLTPYQKCIVREMAIYKTELWEAKMNCDYFELN